MSHQHHVSPSSKKPRKSDEKKSSTPSAATPSPEATSGSSEGARSHHKKKQCPVPECSFHGNDLRRHLQTHVRNNEIASEAVDKLLSIVHAGADTRGKSQARKGQATSQGQKKEVVPSAWLQPKCPRHGTSLRKSKSPWLCPRFQGSHPLPEHGYALYRA